MPKAHDRPLACPACGFKDSFVLNVACIRGETWVQARPLRFKRDSTGPRKFDFTVPLILSCSQCGQPLPVPAEIAGTFKSARR